MIVTIYIVESEDSDGVRHECTRAFDKVRVANKFYNRQRKRMVHQDVVWDNLLLQRVTFKGTPREIACMAHDGKCTEIETLELTERNKL